MPKKTFRSLPKSVRVNIRREKAEIRKKNADAAVRQQKIVELYSSFGVSAK
jgi:hypothetical protein